QLGCGQQPALPQQRAELVQRGQEGDGEERRDAPLQDLTGEAEVDGGEPVHDDRLRRAWAPRQGLTRYAGHTLGRRTQRWEEPSCRKLLPSRRTPPEREASRRLDQSCGSA